MAKKKSIKAILDELYAATNLKLQHLLDVNSHLGDSELDPTRRLQLTIEVMDIWKELAPMHLEIRKSNPEGKAFFDKLDEEYAKFVKDMTKADNESQNKEL